MNICSIFFGFAIGWFLDGIINLIFSSKKLTRKLEKNMSEWDIEESCFRNKIGAILYFCFAIIFLIIGLYLFKENLK